MKGELFAQLRVKLPALIPPPPRFTRALMSQDVSPHPAPLSPSNDTPKTLAESAYLQLRQDIVTGKHAPGSKLRVEHLKALYRVGAGTLREALLLLVTDALVTVQGQRGFRIAPISLDDFEDITRVRTLLETEALLLSMQHGDDAWESEAVAAFHRLTLVEARLEQADVGFDEWETQNRAFHDSLLAACPSLWLRHFLSMLYQQSERYRRLVLFDAPVPRNVHAEHEALLNAALQRDTKTARQLITQHIQATLTAIRSLPASRFPT